MIFFSSPVGFPHIVLDLQYGYGSIPIHTIFRGMNIHLPAILMFTRGTWFWHTAICWNDKDSSFMFYSWIPTFWYNHSSCGFALQRALLLKEIPWPKYRKPFQSPRNIYMLYMWLEGVWLFHVLPFFPVLISDYTMWQFNQCLQFQVQFQPLQLPHRSRWSHPRVGAIFMDRLIHLFKRYALPIQARNQCSHSVLRVVQNCTDNSLKGIWLCLTIGYPIPSVLWFIIILKNDIN